MHQNTKQGRHFYIREEFQWNRQHIRVMSSCAVSCLFLDMEQRGFSNTNNPPIIYRPLEPLPSGDDAKTNLCFSVHSISVEDVTWRVLI
ncbi:hypothetical protein J6590_089350 [Homalodisca vitripennis]|nr:hypothetical protein J6590_089350 [Homalodisca vitripennis]